MSNYMSPGGYRVLPPVVKNLIIINVLFFLAKFVAYSSLHIDLDDILGLHYWGSDKFYPFQFISYMFMHANFGHIFFNMFALWMFGAALENHWGAKRFLIFYFFTGIGAALVHYTVFYFQVSPMLHTINAYLAHPSVEVFNAFLNSNEFVPTPHIGQYYQQVFAPAIRSASSDSQSLQATVDFMNFYKNDFLSMPNVVGASGAIYGLLLAFGMTFPNAMIYLYFLFPIKAKWFVLGFGLLELFSGISNNANDNVAHFAHLGGMLFGIILILYWRKQDAQRDYFQF
jgi:membrane associated rhomboid family serine protease